MTTRDTEALDQLRATIRRWVADEIAPNVDAWEADGALPKDLLLRTGAVGFLGLAVPEADGGQGADAWADVVLLEEVGRVSAAVATTLAAQTDLPLVRTAGTDAQRERWLRPALAGEVVVAVAVTDPPDPADAVVARRSGDGWVLAGAKPWVVNGSRADVALVRAATADGPALFLVDTSLPGVAVDEEVDTLGLRAADVAALRFDDVELTADDLVGEVGEADGLLASDRVRHRLLAAAVAVAAADAEVERATDYARQREAFGRPIIRFQAVKHRLVEMATAVETARAAVHAAVDRWPAEHRDREFGADARTTARQGAVHLAVEVAMANLAAARTAWQVADDSMQTHGGYGYSEEFLVERTWRDVRAARFVHGSDEALREEIADLVIADPDGWRPPRPLLAGHATVQDAADDFVARGLTPHVEEWERQRDFPREMFRTVGAAGWFGAKFDPRWGGTGPDVLAEVCWLEALARSGSGGLSADLGATSQLAAVYLDRQGTDEQKARWLAPSISGEAVGALGVTEPGAGSDVNGLRTRARRDGGDWVLDGAKVFITNGPWADHVVVAARTDPDAGHAGITLFVVERGMSGFTSRRMKMLGWRTSHTGELTFEGVRVPDGHRLGDEGRGFYAIMQNFAWERLTLALGALVAAEECLAMAVRHARDHRVGGTPLADRQAFRHAMADLATEITRARALTDRALELHLAAEDSDAASPPDAGLVLRLTAMAKLVTQRLAVQAADACLQAHGAAGYRMDHPAQRYLRDARLGPIGGGTDDIMREIIAGTLGM